MRLCSFTSVLWWAFRCNLQQTEFLEALGTVALTSALLLGWWADTHICQVSMLIAVHFIHMFFCHNPKKNQRFFANLVGLPQRHKQSQNHGHTTNVINAWPITRRCWNGISGNCNSFHWFLCPGGTSSNTIQHAVPSAKRLWVTTQVSLLTHCAIARNLQIPDRRSICCRNSHVHMQHIGKHLAECDWLDVFFDGSFASDIAGENFWMWSMVGMLQNWTAIFAKHWSAVLKFVAKPLYQHQLMEKTLACWCREPFQQRRRFQALTYLFWILVNLGMPSRRFWCILTATLQPTTSRACGAQSAARGGVVFVSHFEKQFFLQEGGSTVCRGGQWGC